MKGATGLWLMDLGILLFTGAVIFQLITLPVEFDASKRALAQLTETGAVMPEEVSQAEQVLDAAALTSGQRRPWRHSSSCAWC